LLYKKIQEVKTMSFEFEHFYGNETE